MNSITVISWRDLWNPEAGGAEVYMNTLAESIAKKGYSVSYLTPRYKGSKKEELINGVKYIRVGSKYLSYFVIPLYFLFKLRNKTELLIECYNAWPYLVPALHKNSLVGSMHLQDSEWYDHFPTGFKTVGGAAFKLISRLLLKLFYRNRKMFTISESSAKSIESLNLNPSTLEYIYPGINDSLIVSDFNPLEFKEEKRKSGVFSMISIGRLSRLKRVHLSIELAHYLIKELSLNVELHIAGKGECGEELKNLAVKLGIEDKVIFYGYVSDQEKIKLFREANLHLQLSEYEGWGITVIEAAAWGTPTLAFDVAGLRDSVAGCGFLVEDVERLKEVAAKSVNSFTHGTPYYWDKITASRERAEKFKWSTQIDKFEKIVSSSLRIPRS